MRRLLMAIGLALLFSVLAVADDPSCPPNYGYSGYAPPSQWRYVSGWYCAEPMQSPINIATPFDTERDKPIKVDYKAMHPKVENSGHDFRVIPTEENSIDVMVDGREIHAILQNFHFHTPSEHKLRGNSYTGEIHFVHQDTNGKIFVIAVFLTQTKTNNPKLQPIIDQVRTLNLCQSNPTTAEVQPLLPAEIKNYFRYKGTLTTPKCDPDVTFLVVPTPMSIGQSQVRELRRFGDNARTPVQDRGGRPITHVMPPAK